MKPLHACRRLCDKVVDEPQTTYVPWQWEAPLADEEDEEDAELDT